MVKCYWKWKPPVNHQCRLEERSLPEVPSCPVASVTLITLTIKPNWGGPSQLHLPLWSYPPSLLCVTHSPPVNSSCSLNIQLHSLFLYFFMLLPQPKCLYFLSQPVLQNLPSAPPQQVDTPLWSSYYRACLFSHVTLGSCHNGSHHSLYAFHWWPVDSVTGQVERGEAVSGRGSS